MSLPDRFDIKSESEIYERWEEAGVFTADADRSTRVGGDRDPFTIVMPPPNVTAILHLGHALTMNVQDTIIRWARMRQQEALYVPGTDHAGIATQNVVEKLIAKDGKTRFDLGREAFVRRTEQFVAETGGTILEQLRSIGVSADWTRTAYTLSPELSKVVREAFVRLYESKLIYRGHRVIHWCPRCLTSLSDEEAEFTEETGALYHIRYGDVVIATSRPETMLADVAVAVNPKDARYAKLVGTTVTLPILDLEIPVIADEYADPAFGTGVVKITPAHDANDFEVGKRHKLPMPVVIDANGNMAEDHDAKGRVPAWLTGDDRFVARKKILKKLQELGVLEKTEQQQRGVRHCYRCDTVVEPRLSDQWFVTMAPLAKPALDGLRSGAIRILPERWEGVYVHWLENIRDWNISRQLWWGHRIPVWYCKDCDPPYHMYVSRTDLAECPRCGGPVRQDEDVLDTWFSSWLWPLSTLGWPDEHAKDFRAFYPTDVLVSGPDILFFWVARMVMAGYFFAGRTPYHTILLHGMARDTLGRKMSKSLGNGLDPNVVVQQYGADALRWTLISGMGLGADIQLDPNDLEKTFAPGRNFVTKLWNIGRFLLEKAGTAPVKSVREIPAAKLTRADQWILWRLDQAIADADTAMVGMRLNDLAETGRRFVWNELADWYVEAIKGRLATQGEDAEVARAVLVHAFDGALRLLHPVVPFVSEAIWQQLPSHVQGTFLATAQWPAAGRDLAGSVGAREFEHVREAVGALRQIRAEYSVPPATSIEAFAVGANGVFKDEADLFERLSRSSLRVGTAAPQGAAAHAVLAGGVSLVVPLKGLVDVEKECARLRGELESLDKQLTALSGRLANEKFVSKAPKDVVDAERKKQSEWQARQQQLRDKVQTLCGG